jgi:hypothetical protein
LIVIYKIHFSKTALIVSKSRFSGKMIFLENFHQKHSLFLIIILFSLKTSGSSLTQEILKIFSSKEISISSNSTQEIGEIKIISSGVSTISKATCHSSNSSSLSSKSCSSTSISFSNSSSFVTQKILNIFYFLQT